MTTPTRLPTGVVKQVIFCENVFSIRNNSPPLFKIFETDSLQQNVGWNSRMYVDGTVQTVP